MNEKLEIERLLETIQNVKKLDKETMLAVLTFYNFVPELIEKKLLTDSELFNLSSLTSDRKKKIINYIRKRLKDYAKDKKT